MRDIARLRPAPQLDLSIPETLPGAIRERLSAAGIRTCADWERLTRKQRRELWGITPRMLVAISHAVTEALRA